MPTVTSIISSTGKNLGAITVDTFVEAVMLAVSESLTYGVSYVRSENSCRMRVYVRGERLRVKRSLAAIQQRQETEKAERLKAQEWMEKRVKGRQEPA